MAIGSFLPKMLTLQQRLHPFIYEQQQQWVLHYEAISRVSQLSPGLLLCLISQEGHFQGRGGLWHQRESLLPLPAWLFEAVLFSSGMGMQCPSVLTRTTYIWAWIG